MFKEQINNPLCSTEPFSTNLSLQVRAIFTLPFSLLVLGFIVTFEEEILRTLLGEF